MLAAIAQLKAELIAKGEATELFGQLRGDGLASSIATIEQGFGDELFYPNVASRAAHLLYFVIKNHPLTDGNKRTGSFLFLWYLRLNQHLLARPVERLINDNTLVALALLVAESKPAQKALMVRLVAGAFCAAEGKRWMTRLPDRPRRRCLRLRDYDYTQAAGAYFVTLCTQDRVCLFGEIVDGEVSRGGSYSPNGRRCRIDSPALMWMHSS